MSYFCLLHPKAVTRQGTIRPILLEESILLNVPGHLPTITQMRSNTYNPSKHHWVYRQFGTSKPLKTNFLFRGALCCQSTANRTRHGHLNQRPPHHPRALCPRAQEPWAGSPWPHLAKTSDKAPGMSSKPWKSFLDNKEVFIKYHHYFSITKIIGHYPVVLRMLELFISHFFLTFSETLTKNCVEIPACGGNTP